MLYLIFAPYEVEATAKGRQQFHDHESFGREPEDPDPYYSCLCQGKKWFNVQQEEIRQTYLTWEWWGFYSYWKDWKGQRWVLKYLFRWCDNVPDWLCREDLEDV